MAKHLRERIALVVFLIFGSGSGCNDNGAMSKTIYRAVEDNDVVVVNDWLREGGDPSLQMPSGESLLYLATGPHGGLDVVKALLNNGANPNLGYRKYTPLMNAASWCDESSVTLLLKSGADPTLENSRGKTALECIGHGPSECEAVLEQLASAVERWNHEHLQTED